MKKMLVFLLALAMIVTTVPASVMAEAAQNDGQLTLEDLKALNRSVRVSQQEYDEVIAIKAMFLVSDYE